MPKPRKDLSFDTPVVNKINFKVNEHFNPESNINAHDLHLNVDIKLPRDKEIGEEINSSCKTALTLMITKRESDFPFEIEIEMEAIFRWDEDADIDLDSYIKYHTPAIIYSYMRPVVSDLVTKAGFPPFNLPFMDFSESDNLNKDNQE